MKCIKNKKTGNVSRVEDKIADSSVTNGTASYCTKQEWKKSLTAKERKSIMDHNGGDPSVKKTDGKQAKKTKIAKIDTSDKEIITTTSDNPTPPVEPVIYDQVGDNPFPKSEDAPKTESKAKRNKKDAPAKDAPAKTDKKPMINKPKVKKAKEE